MKSSKSISLVFLIVISLCFVDIQPVRSQSSGTIYIRADGNVDPVTAPIQRIGDTYTLTEHISGSIKVERDFTVIDGAAHALEGIGEGRGVSIGRGERLGICK